MYRVPSGASAISGSFPSTPTVTGVGAGVGVRLESLPANAEVANATETRIMIVVFMNISLNRISTGIGRVAGREIQSPAPTYISLDLISCRVLTVFRRSPNGRENLAAVFVALRRANSAR